jgi:TrmH family RNA methyltransferase
MDLKSGFTDFSIVLVEPKNGGNIGAVARIMMNFDFCHLVLINPCALDDECYSRARHAQKILDEAVICSSFEEACKSMDYLVATSSIQSHSDKKHLRNPILPEDFLKMISEVNGKIGIVFGREDYGLFNEEISACDIMLRIPTSEHYLSLNLSHSVAIVLYMLYVSQKFIPEERRQIGNIERKKLYQFFQEILEKIDYPDHKKQNTQIMFKRIMGRAIPSTWEYHTLMGVFQGVLQKIKKQK